MPVALTSNDILKELNISRSTFYYLIKNNLFSIPTTNSGRYIWNPELVEQLRDHIKAESETAISSSVVDKIKTTKINNRRYLGNKYKLLDFITETIERECSGINTIADIFAGTGSVSSAFLDKKIITNDLLYFNHICHVAWFGAEHYSEEKVKNLIQFYNAVEPQEENYMSINFANTFFSLEDCRKIGFIREDIEEKYERKLINARERAILITSLLYAMDKIANTCGHYDAYIKGAEFTRHIELALPLASNNNNENNQCYNEDANELVKRIEADLVYIDPPYNSRQYCDAYDYKQKELIQSPLNYTGGKFKLLPQLLPHFPQDVDYFVDLFCGGGNVGINVPCNKVLFNDNNSLLRYMFGTFKNLDKKSTFEMIDKIIERYGLSNTEKYGYEYYGCNSADGLSSYNTKGYLKLRDDFNHKQNLEYNYYVMLFVLIVYAFNNQIRFNKKGEFNLPAGKRDFNKKMREKLSLFIDRLKSGDYKFESCDFRKLSADGWNDKTFVYADPPYLITCATYNEQDGWNETLEKELLSYLDRLNERGIRFALSNVLHSKGKENSILIEWLNKNIGKYRVIYLDYNYSNSNYQTKDRTSKAEEVLIVNY